MTNPAPYAPPPQPGTYRISNVKDKNVVIEVPDYNQDRIATRGWKNARNQHWIVQHSGHGYKFKNCQYDLYLSAPNNKPGAVVCSSRAPTSWDIHRTHEGYLILYEETDAAINLHFAGTNDNNVLLLWGISDCPAHRRWKFERISDDTGNETADTTESCISRLETELAKKNAQLVLQTEELARKDQLIASQAAALHGTESSECVANVMARVYAKFEDIEKIKQEMQAIMGSLGNWTGRKASVSLPSAGYGQANYGELAAQ
ncbi:ricin-type beta-trefoil lectin domain protein [Ceratobasidium sp. AG-Ba]|nr:ricin-type beta-trefoil lectin domain protein [Ceratobasidium sp. AG-Ba]QRW01635.1 ricin-type beta-trefoil lectin domain protein [Ceratobasidium sp. AG-Ba]